MGVAACALLLLTTFPHTAISAGINAEAVLSRTTAVRASRGASSLRVDPHLAVAAQRRAEEIVRAAHFAHVRPDGSSFAQLAEELGYPYERLGENLAIDFLHERPMVDAWLASPHHQRNLLAPTYGDTGVGVASGAVNGIPTIVVVQLFGSLRDPLLRGWGRLPAALPMS